MYKIILLLVICFSPLTGSAQALQDPLLDHLIGKWVLQGTIAGSATTHDVTAEWVLGHEYIRLHEVSRERADNGQPLYEAIVFIGRDEATGGYAILWLDSTGGGGITAQGIGHGKRSGDQIAFLFSDFHNTFVYSKTSNTWQWIMDNEKNGKLEPFARVTLSQK
jgi:hypothetical protein